MGNRIDNLGDKRGGVPFTKGASGNPGGRASVTKAIVAAGFDPGDLRAEVIQQYVKAMRELDRTTASWRAAMEKLMYYLFGKPKETIAFEAADHQQGGPSLDEVVGALDEDGLAALERLMAKLEAAGFRFDPHAGTEH